MPTRFKSATRIGVFGKSGSGKSTLVQALLKGVSRVIVFDPLDEYSVKGWIRCASPADFLRALKKSWNKNFKIAFVPTGGRNHVAMLHWLAQAILIAQEPYRTGRDNREIIFVVEELNLAFPVTNLKQEYWGFTDICLRGRHYGINVIGVSQRPALVHTNFRGNLDKAYYFQLSDHTDLATVLKTIGPSRRADILRLTKGQFLCVTEAGIRSGNNRLP